MRCNATIIDKLQGTPSEIEGIITIATVTGANFQLVGYFLKDVLTITLAVIAASNAKIFAPIIDMNNSAIPQPAIVLMMREMVAERKLSISGSVTTITEMMAHILCLSSR